MKEQELITKKYNFKVGTRYVRSDVEDEYEIKFTKEEWEDKEKRESIIQECFKDWVWENIDICWGEKEE